MTVYTFHVLSDEQLEEVVDGLERLDWDEDLSLLFLPADDIETLTSETFFLYYSPQYQKYVFQRNSQPEIPGTYITVREDIKEEAN